MSDIASDDGIPGAADRRMECRHRLKDGENAAVLGWWEGQEFRMAFVRLMNVSSSGAAVQSDRVPGEVEHVYFRLASGTPMDWTLARIVRRKRPVMGAPRIHLALESPCPYEAMREILAKCRR